MSALAVLPVTAGGSYHAMVTLTIGNDDTWIDDEMRWEMIAEMVTIM